MNYFVYSFPKNQMNGGTKLHGRFFLVQRRFLGTLADLEKHGIMRVVGALHEAIAHVAGVSVLRISNFFV